MYIYFEDISFFKLFDLFRVNKEITQKLNKY